jgi:hypothetical protein
LPLALVQIFSRILLHAILRAPDEPAVVCGWEFRAANAEPNSDTFSAPLLEGAMTGRRRAAVLSSSDKRPNIAARIAI